MAQLHYRESSDSQRAGWYEEAATVFIISLKRSGSLARSIVRTQNYALAIQTIENFVATGVIPETKGMYNVIVEHEGQSHA